MKYNFKTLQTKGNFFYNNLKLQVGPTSSGRKGRAGGLPKINLKDASTGWSLGHKGRKPQHCHGSIARLRVSSGEICRHWGRREPDNPAGVALRRWEKILHILSEVQQPRKGYPYTVSSQSVPDLH